MTLRATYRVQFHEEFTFADAEKLVPYFAALGISHLYSSPILTARAGSRHGYDVVDHARINPELGGEPAFRSLAAALRARDIGILLDIVPNHMAVGGADNPYWLDLLEKGRDSVFANMFDIDWDAEPSSSANDRVLVPMLARPFAESMSAGEITLGWDARLGKLAFAYGDNRFPLRKDDYDVVIGGAADAEHADLRPFAEPAALVRLLSHQHFRLAYWRDAGDRINWRRFFDITSLAALRVEDDAVFEQTHAAIFRFFGEGLIDGVRVDHVDGLADPAAYCRRLRARLEGLLSQRPEALPRERAIVLVEKVLADGEDLPADWDVDGTTGYDFMNAVSAFEHDPASEAAFTRMWAATSGRSADFECEEQQARLELLGTAFANALRTTAAAFGALQESNVIEAGKVEAAVASVIQRLRAYRTYALGDTPEPQPGPILDAAVRSARAVCTKGDADVGRALDLVESVMRGEHATRGADARDAVRRFNQLAAPVAAKAVEDTALYRYGRWLSRNDVGFSPDRFALSVDEFHADNERRGARYPSALLTTGTHDHKRGEDSRARLAALSELPAIWKDEQAAWFALNAAARPGGIAPGDEYQLYQALVGAWPIGLSPSDDVGVTAFTERVLAWREKSLREAKLETSWSEPNANLERAHADFVRRILDPGHPFVARLARFIEWLAPAGALDSLTSCVLRCTCPGVPDLYQGAELWDFSFVDPDNRRPVDFTTRQGMLDGDVRPAARLNDWKSGAVKLALIGRLLSLRAQLPSLFSAGEYRRIRARSAHIFAFARVSDSRVLLVAVPRLCANGAIARRAPLPTAELGCNYTVDLPAEWRQRQWRDGLDPAMPLAPIWDGAPLFAQFPAAVLVSD